MELLGAGGWASPGSDRDYRPLAGWADCRAAGARQGTGRLFLEETFTSIPELGRELYPIFPVDLLARYEYPTLEYLKQVQCPVLISHSRGDMFIVFEHGQRLYEAANQPKAFTELRGGHSSAFSEDAATYEAGVEAFLTEVLGW